MSLEHFPHKTVLTACSLWRPTNISCKLLGIAHKYSRIATTESSMNHCRLTKEEISLLTSLLALVATETPSMLNMLSQLKVDGPFYFLHVRFGIDDELMFALGALRLP